MPEPLKNIYSTTFVDRLGQISQQYFPPFNCSDFKAYVLNEDWGSFALKQRMAHIARGLNSQLPDHYPDAIQIVQNISRHFSDLLHMCFPQYVELYGLQHWEESVNALEYLTPFSSSEFAVRPFIVQNPERMMAQMHRWSESTNFHVRRLASEGCRPRLPWAMALPAFKKDPGAILPILDALKDDNEDYVRRSVANNLNDISKDHPDLVLSIAEKWKGASKKRDALIKHGCRTLLKQSNARALSLFNLSNHQHILVKHFVLQRHNLSIGQDLIFDFDLTTEQKSLGALRIEYQIDYVKANGKTTAKRFKISEVNEASALKRVSRKHAMKNLSTRTLYPGTHQISIIVNGVSFWKESFELQPGPGK